MNKAFGVQPVVGAEAAATLAPVEDYLAELHELLAHSPQGVSVFALVELDLFKGLSPEEYRLIEPIVRPLIFEKGEVIIREGAEAKLFFVVARGTVSVQIKVQGQGDRKKRVASIG